MLSQAAKGSDLVPERRLALIHRVIIPDEEYPKEYAILVTDHRSIFIRQKKSRSNFWLRREISYGTALITDIAPKTLRSEEHTSELQSRFDLVCRLLLEKKKK